MFRALGRLLGRLVKRERVRKLGERELWYFYKAVAKILRGPELPDWPILSVKVPQLGPLTEGQVREALGSWAKDEGEFQAALHYLLREELLVEEDGQYWTAPGEFEYVPPGLF